MLSRHIISLMFVSLIMSLPVYAEKAAIKLHSSADFNQQVATKNFNTSSLSHDCLGQSEDNHSLTPQDSSTQSSPPYYLTTATANQATSSDPAKTTTQNTKPSSTNNSGILFGSSQNMTQNNEKNNDHSWTIAY